MDTDAILRIDLFVSPDNRLIVLRDCQSSSDVLVLQVRISLTSFGDPFLKNVLDVCLFDCFDVRRLGEKRVRDRFVVFD